MQSWDVRGSVLCCARMVGRIPGQPPPNTQLQQELPTCLLPSAVLTALHQNLSSAPRIFCAEVLIQLQPFPGIFANTLLRSPVFQRASGGLWSTMVPGRQPRANRSHWLQGSLSPLPQPSFALFAQVHGCYSHKTWCLS